MAAPTASDEGMSDLELQVFLMKGVYMTQSMLFLVLAVLYAGYPSAVISVYVGQQGLGNQVAEFCLRGVGLLYLFIAGVLYTASTVHTTWMNKAVAFGLFAHGVWFTWLELSGEADRLGIMPTMGPVPIRSTVFWAIYDFKGAVCFACGPAANAAKAKAD